MNTQPSGGPTILIVDDDDPFARTVRERLAAAGYVVRHAATGEEALVGLEAAHANVILVTLLLPDTDGLILCASLKARTSAPIVVLSHRPREVDRVLALELGAFDVLNVPVDFDVLVARLQAALQKQSGTCRAVDG